MLYALMRRLARIALRWYYRDVEIIGAERVPRDTPLLIVANHPNAMVDPMLVATSISRRVTFTGKATLFENPFLRAFLGAVGVVPLRRASDERARRQAGGAPDPRRNEEAFRAVIGALGARRAVLIFPEGKSHDEPSIAPLKTGTARMALQARAAGVGELSILPIGFVFENKSQPRTRILVEVGEPIALDDWSGAGAADAVDRLTGEIDRRLRAVTMNFDTAAAAAETARVGALLAPEGAGALGGGVSWAEVVAVTRRVDSARRVLERAVAAGGELARRADRLRAEVSAAEQVAAREGLDLRDAGIDTSVGSGAAFVAREGAITTIAAPFAVIGRIIHWPAVTIARTLARRWSESGADPAMQTLLVGAPLVLVTWAAITAIAWHFAGAAIALVTLAALPLLAECDFALRDRAARARARLRAYLRFRREPALQQTLVGAISAARDEAAELERQLLTGNAA
ncbi:MAG TPA: lysophospholipid acyltransferase family protein [Gemmatimonadaceae bacterium]|nr:lysophospholipid acyltransferase family protein [Gemmatimonadaceae bacterium]